MWQDIYFKKFGIAVICVVKFGISILYLIRFGIAVLYLMKYGAAVICTHTHTHTHTHIYIYIYIYTYIRTSIWLAKTVAVSVIRYSGQFPPVVFIFLDRHLVKFGTDSRVMRFSICEFHEKRRSERCSFVTSSACRETV